MLYARDGEINHVKYGFGFQIPTHKGRIQKMATKTLKKKATNKKVSTMTVKELKKLIKDTVLEVIDPDYGLELRPEVEKELQESMKSKERIPVESVAKELGLKW